MFAKLLFMTGKSDLIFNKRLLQLIESSDLSEKELQKGLSMTKQSLYQVSSGKASFTIPQLIAGAKLFNVSMDYLCGLKGGEPDPFLSKLKNEIEKEIKKRVR